MQVGLEPFVPQQFLRRVLLGAEVDDLDDPDGRERRLRLLEGLEHLDDERPYLKERLVGEFLLVEVDIVEIHIDEVEQLRFRFVDGVIQYCALLIVSLGLVVVVQFLDGRALQEGVDHHVHREVIHDDRLHYLHQQFGLLRLGGDLALLVVDRTALPDP